MGRLVDADALYNGAMKQEYFDFVNHDDHGRESFAYSCAMQRLAEAPTIDAIPMEWFTKMIYSCGVQGYIDAVRALRWVIGTWKMTKEQWEQEAR